MSASLKPLTLEEFLAWERTQEARYDFDGIQPVAMTGGGRLHSRIGTRFLAALSARVKPPYEVFGPNLKIITTGRVRYPDGSVVSTSSGDDDSDLIEPTIVAEVVSPSTVLADRREKAIEYRAVPSIFVYLLLEQDRPEITIRRRSGEWAAVTVAGLDAMLELPEIGVTVPLAFIYDAT